MHAYARRTLLNTYLVDCRRKRRGEVLTGTIDAMREEAVEPYSPELKITLTEALAKLAPRARAIVVLRYWEDMSVEQVAALLGCSPGNVKSQSARGLAKLRVLLGESGGPEPPADWLVKQPADDRRKTRGARHE